MDKELANAVERIMLIFKSNCPDEAKATLVRERVAMAMQEALRCGATKLQSLAEGLS